METSDHARISGGKSNSIFDRLFTDLARLIQPTGTVLDIGPGRGKYGRLIRETGLQCRLEALELCPDYVEAFDLRDIYDTIHIGDATKLPDEPQARDRVYDLIVLGDSIEHLRKSEGLDLLNFLTYRSAYIAVIVPEFLHYEVGAMPHCESHISAWSEEDFRWHDRWAYMRSEYMQFFLLRGYQRSAINLPDLVAQSNANPSPVLRQSGAVLKTSKLELHCREHVEVIDGNGFVYRQP